jgi:hypothetical protein
MAWNKKCTDLLATTISSKTQNCTKMLFHHHGERSSVCIRCPAQRLLLNLGQVYMRAYLASSNVEGPPIGYSEKQWKKAVMERFVASMTAQETTMSLPSKPDLLASEGSLSEASPCTSIESSDRTPSARTNQSTPSRMNLPLPSLPPSKPRWTCYHKEILVESLRRVCQIKHLPVSVSLTES